MFMQNETKEIKQTREQMINIPTFQKSIYNIEVQPNDTIEEVYGIIERKLGEAYKSWFTLELASHPKEKNCDYYELSNTEDRILVRANSGVCLATGINYYLKQYCNVHISQVGNQTKMPDVLPKILSPLYKCTKAKICKPNKNIPK